jgi:integration host factor subunit alpha
MIKSQAVHSVRELGVAAGEGFGPRRQPLKRTLTRVDLAEAVYRRIGLSRKESAHLVESVLEEIAIALSAGQPVKVSSFGRFLVREKSERIGRNPKTGVEVPITPRRVLIFKPSNILKAKINGFEAPADEDE